MALRSLSIATLLCVFAGCASTPSIETRSYALQNRTAEEALIKGKLDDEAARLGGDKLAAMVEREGGKLEALKITDDGTAIVRTTPHAHKAIEAALARARKDLAANRSH